MSKSLALRLALMWMVLLFFPFKSVVGADTCPDDPQRQPKSLKTPAGNHVIFHYDLVQETYSLRWRKGTALFGPSPRLPLTVVCEPARFEWENSKFIGLRQGVWQSVLVWHCTATTERTEGTTSDVCCRSWRKAELNCKHRPTTQYNQFDNRASAINCIDLSALQRSPVRVLMISNSKTVLFMFFGARGSKKNRELKSWFSNLTRQC